MALVDGILVNGRWSTVDGHYERDNANWMDWHRRDGAVDVRAFTGEGLPRYRLQSNEIEDAEPARQGREVGRHAGRRRGGIGRGVYHRRAAERCARGVPRERRHSSIGAARHDHRRHDDHRAKPDARDLRSGQLEGRIRRRRAGVGRRCGREERHLVDHGRRRQRQRRQSDAAVPGHGQEHRPPGRTRQWPAHEDVQSDCARGHDHRRVREPAVRI